MGNNEISDPEKPTSSGGGVGTHEEGQRGSRRQSGASTEVSGPWDGASLSLSNRGLETADLEGFIVADTENALQPLLQLRQQQPTRVPSSIATAFPQSIAKTMVRLDLSRNKLTSLPKELFGGATTTAAAKPTTTATTTTSTSSSTGDPTDDDSLHPSCLVVLEHLDVGRNQLRGLPHEIGNCKRLKTLVALSNNLRWSEFPHEALVSLPLLEVLDLRWNRKMNSQSSRRKLNECFPNDNDNRSTHREGNTTAAAAATTTTARVVLSPDLNLCGRKDEQEPSSPVVTGSDDAVGVVVVVAAKKKLSACDRDANDLRSQLEPLSTPQLRKRLHRTFGVVFDDRDETAYDREVILQRLLGCYHHGKSKNETSANNSENTSVNNPPVPLRTVRYERGVALDPVLVEELLFEMEAIRWPRTTRERPKIAAEGYVILQRPTPPTTETPLAETPPAPAKSSKAKNKAKREAEKIRRFLGIWTKALEAIESVDKEFAARFTALAVTKNFTGSPHIDTLNIAPFYGLSLGDFNAGGGKLCVECSATCVAEIDTRGRPARVDGRFCHWVSDYVGTRYSLIYYVTHGEVVPQTTAIFPPPPSAHGDGGGGDGGSPPSRWVPPPVFVP